MYFLYFSTADRTAVHAVTWNKGLYQGFISYRQSKRPSQYAGDTTQFLIPIQRRDRRREYDRIRGARMRLMDSDGKIAHGLANTAVR